MKILLTGGCGFIGSNLYEKLESTGNNVIILDNLCNGKLSNVKHDASIIVGDIRNKKLITELIHEKFDVIYHIAALPRIKPSFDNPREFIDVNTTGTINILELARLSNSRFIYAGSSSAYFDVMANPYAYSKWVGEQHCILYNKIYGVSVAIARFFNVYGPKHLRDGPNANVVGIFEKQKIDNKPLTVTGDGTKKRDFTHVFDICEGLYRMKDNYWKAEYFDLGRQNNHAIIDVANMFKPNGIQFIDPRPGEAENTLANCENTKKLLNFEPKLNLSDYIESFLSENKL